MVNNFCGPFFTHGRRRKCIEGVLVKDLELYGRDNIKMAVRGMCVLESSALARSRWLAVCTTVTKVKDLHKTVENA